MTLHQDPSGRAVPKAQWAWASSSGAAGRVASPSSPCGPQLPAVGSGIFLLRWRCTRLPALFAMPAGTLGLFPLPSAPYLTTSPSFSHHVRTSGPPQNTEHFNSPVGNRGKGPVWGPTGRNLRPSSRRAVSPPGAYPTLRSAWAQLPGAARLSMSRSPALLLLLRAPLDRIGQQCGACHWPGEADGALIGRARARGAPHSTVSERFETPKAPLCASGKGGGRQGRSGKKVGEEER